MSNPYSLRRVLTVLAALALPAATCGVAPALQDLMKRTQRLERLVENAQLPPVLMDDHGMVVGRVLEYNDLMVYSSVLDDHRNEATPGRPTVWAPEPSQALATILYEVPNRTPVVLEANRDALLTPLRSARAAYLFESPDCSGTAWMEAPPDGASVFGYARIAAPGQTLYTADLDAPRERIFVRSVLVVASGSGEAGRTNEIEGCSDRYNGFEADNMLPLLRAFDLDAFMPPFHIADQRELWLY